MATKMIIRRRRRSLFQQ